MAFFTGGSIAFLFPVHNAGFGFTAYHQVVKAV